ncbi:TPR domain protein [Chitinispirillum alkaliphilum]|nr:TPR domain protein [Chitinispirillum alkaliphilum]
MNITSVIQMRKLVVFLPLTILSLLFFAGCASRQQFPFKLPHAEIHTDSVEALQRAQNYFIRARDFERRGLDEMARRFYEMAYRMDPGSETLREILLRKYVQSSNYSLALALLKEADTLSRDDTRLLTSIYLYTGETLKAAEQLEKLDDKREEEVYSLGMLYKSMGMRTKAIELFSQYWEKYPRNYQIGLQLIRLLIRENQYDSAQTVVSTLTRYHAGDPDLSAIEGYIFLFKGDTTAAMEQFERTLELEPGHDETLRSLAQIYLQKEEFTTVIDLYEQLVEASPLGEHYLAPLAILYIHHGQYDKAEAILLDLLKITPHDTELLYHLGRLYSLTDRNFESVMQFEKALDLEPGYEPALIELSYLLLRKRQFESAATVIKEYVELYPQSVVAMRLMGYIHSHNKDYASASEILKKAVTIDSTNHEVWFELGSMLERNREIDKAADAFRIALKLKPDDPMTSNYLGYMWADEGLNLDSAKILIETAIAADPGNGAYLDSYAWVHYRLGNYEKAYLYQKKAVKRLNNDPVLFSHLGDILYKLGDMPGALDAYKKSLDLNSEESDRIRLRVIELKYLTSEEGN